MNLDISDQEQSPVLVAVLEYGEFPEMLRVAADVRAATGREVLLLFATPNYRALGRDSNEAVLNGFRWVDWQGTIHAEAADVLTSAERLEPQLTRATGVIRGLLRDLKDRPLMDLVKVVLTIRRLRCRYRAMSAIVDKLKPALVVAGQDFLGGELSFLLIAARKVRIPTLLVPFAMFNQRELAVFACGRTEQHVSDRWLNRVVATLYPDWVLEWQGVKLLRFPAYLVLAIEIAGVRRGNPWVPCSEPVDVIACESKNALDAFVAMGIPRSRVVAVGGPVHDRLAELVRHPRKSAVLARYRLDQNRPLIVCGWPANIFSWVGQRNIAFADYPSLARTWAFYLAAARDRYGAHVVVSVHPKTSDAETTEIRLAGLPFQRGGSDELIASCDLFTTLNGSSITAWAIACEKPVLLFDCYQTGYTDFDSVPGVRIVYDAQTFGAELGHLCRDDAARAALADAQSRAAADWGILDGGARNRLGKLVTRLICGQRAEHEARFVLENDDADEARAIALKSTNHK